jgi:hypothetical protein
MLRVNHRKNKKKTQMICILLIAIIFLKISESRLIHQTSKNTNHFLNLKYQFG